MSYENIGSEYNNQNAGGNGIVPGQPATHGQTVLDAGMHSDSPIPPTPARKPQYAQVPLELMIKWPDTVADFSLNIGNDQVRFDPVSSIGRMEGLHGWVLIEGLAGREEFSIVIDATFATILLENSELELSKLPANPRDASLIVEFICNPLIERLQQSTSGNVSINSAQTVHQLPSLSWLCLDGNFQGQSGDIAIAMGGQTIKQLEKFVSTRTLPGEKKVDPQLQVKIGHIALPLGETQKVGSGDTIDTGIDPTGDVRGILERSDKKFWPILIDDDSVTITGGLQDPVNFYPGNGSVLSSLQIGILTMSACERLAIKRGAYFQVERIEDNGAKLWIGSRVHGQGSLGVNDGNLVIAIHQLGDER